MSLAGIPTIDDVRAAREAIRPYINSTPVHEWKGRLLSESVAADTEVVLKLELFQRAGSFKARGALLGIFALDEAARQRGVTAVSAVDFQLSVVLVIIIITLTVRPTGLFASRFKGKV